MIKYVFTELHNEWRVSERETTMKEKSSPVISMAYTVKHEMIFLQAVAEEKPKACFPVQKLNFCLIFYTPDPRSEVFLLLASAALAENRLNIFYGRRITSTCQSAYFHVEPFVEVNHNEIYVQHFSLSPSCVRVDFSPALNIFLPSELAFMLSDEEFWPFSSLEQFWVIN